MYFSTYEERIAQTPSDETNRWEGQRGESRCLPGSDSSKAILDSMGVDGIEYKNGEPDFSPVSESTVKIGYMNEERTSKNVADGRDSKKTTYVHYDDNGQVKSRSHHADRNDMADIQMKYYNPGNFDQADILTAEQWSKDGRDDKEWTAEDVAQYRKENNLTWHECNDGETMMLIPTDVNSDFGHLGGVGEIKRKNDIIRDVNEEYDYCLSEDDDIDDGLLKAREEAGYEDMDDEQKEDFDEIYHLKHEREKYDQDTETEMVEKADDNYERNRHLF